MSTMLPRRGLWRHLLSGLPKKSRGMGYGLTAFALDTSTLTCMPAVESRDGWIASKTRSQWEEAANLKRLRGRSYGWQAQRLPSSPARSSMSLAASEQQGATPGRSLDAPCSSICAQVLSIHGYLSPPGCEHINLAGDAR